MWSTHIYIYLDTNAPQVMARKYKWKVTIDGHAKTAEKAGSTLCGRHQATLEALAEALTVFRQNCTITIHAEDTWVLHALVNNLEEWEENGYRKKNGEEIRNRDLWERIRKKTRYQRIAIHTESPGFGRGEFT